jgi:hypothetical protein
MLSNLPLKNVNGYTHLGFLAPQNIATVTGTGTSLISFRLPVLVPQKWNDYRYIVPHVKKVCSFLFFFAYMEIIVPVLRISIRTERCQ